MHPGIIPGLTPVSQLVTQKQLIPYLLVVDLQVLSVVAVEQELPAMIFLPLLPTKNKSIRRPPAPIKREGKFVFVSSIDLLLV
jgi:anaerobic C4-dicarboxylate transporter